MLCSILDNNFCATLCCPPNSHDLIYIGLAINSMATFVPNINKN